VELLYSTTRKIKRTFERRTEIWIKPEKTAIDVNFRQENAN